MLIGISFGLAACVLWGFTYLLPLLLPDYPTTYISVARGIVMGVTALAGLALQRQYLKQVNLKDWNTAFWLTLIGNLIQPWCLFSAVQYAGVALAATFFGLIPVLVALIANERDKRKGKKYLPLSKLILPLSVIFIGLILANFEGLINVLEDYKSNPNFLIGVIYSVLSTAMWTWYPIRTMQTGCLTILKSVLSSLPVCNAVCCFRSESFYTLLFGCFQEISRNFSVLRLSPLSDGPFLPVWFALSAQLPYGML